jgi:hypothetical protein
LVETTDIPKKKPRRRGWRIARRIASLFATICLLIVISPIAFAAFIYFQPEGDVIRVPKLGSFLESKLGENVSNMEMAMSETGLSKGESLFNPKLVFRDVVIREVNGAPILKLPKISADSNIVTGLYKSPESGRLLIEQADLFLWRDRTGKFNLSASEDPVSSDFLKSLDRAIDSFFSLPVAKNIQSFELTDVALTYLDGKLTRLYELEHGNLQVAVEGKELSISSAFKLARKNEEPTLLRFSGRRTKGDTSSDITFKVDNADPVTLADQIPALDWLRNIQADASASIVISLGEETTVVKMDGVLELGAGRLRATPTNSAAAFRSAKAYFDYDADQDAIGFSNFELDANQGTLIGSAFTTMTRNLAGTVTGGNTDLTIEKLTLNRPDVFENEIAFQNGSVQVEMVANPFHVKVNKAVINQDDMALVASGDLWALTEDWQSQFQIRLDQVQADQLKALWPTIYIPKTRRWITENLQKGRVSDFNGFFSRQNGKAAFDFKFAFDDVTTGLVKTVEPLTGGAGEGNLTNEQITLSLDAGILKPTGNEPLDISGSVFHIPNIQLRPAIGQISLSAKGDLKSALEVLDAPKFQFISKFGKTTDAASGDASIKGWLELPLVKGVAQDQIKFDFAGVARDVESSKLIKGHKLDADKVSISASDSEISLSGDANVDGVPVNFNWAQSFIENPSKTSELTADLTLSQKSLSAFNIALPEGAFSGSAPARLNIDLPAGRPAKFQLSSSLKGSQMRIDSLGWRKGKNAKAKLKVSGVFSEPAEIEKIDLAASGLTAQGKVNLNSDGSFQSAEFPTVKLGKWLSTSVKLTGQGTSAVTQLKGGRVDLRQLNLNAGNGGKAGPLEVSLDRLRITDTLELTSFSSSIKRNGAPSGQFKARVNGGAQISGVLSKGKYGTKIKVRGKDAGAILRSAGMLDNIRDGALTLSLEPAKEAGVYTGSFVVDNLRMLHSNSLAALMDGLSLVGLLQKLEKEGIRFNEAKGWFTLRPEGVELREVSMVGVSMGMSLKGWYASKSKTVDFDGVITPIYAVNGAFERVAGKLFGRQKGEGLFSFVYTMKGSAADPKVRVKPLSILTPGVFRQIFRTDIPKPEN